MIEFKIDIHPTDKDSEETVKIFEMILKHSKFEGLFDEILRECEEKLKKKTYEIIDMFKKPIKMNLDGEIIDLNK
ncbi:MAG: hypothetical protein GY861_14540 [bacterium]|nr:hypothetical protein [bacterium]